MANMKEIKKIEKELGEALIDATAGAVPKVDEIVKLRDLIHQGLDEGMSLMDGARISYRLEGAIDGLKKWMLKHRVKSITSTDGTVTMTYCPEVYGYRPITDEEQARLDALRASVERVSMSALMDIDPELAAKMCDEAHRTEAPITRACVKCKDQRASVFEADIVGEWVFKVEENKRLFKPEIH